ncbi:GTPase-activating protein [Allomyces javanicus]|nr:GTPase-activating protein [Allomyces javanicus]
MTSFNSSMIVPPASEHPQEPSVQGNGASNASRSNAPPLPALTIATQFAPQPAPQPAPAAAAAPPPVADPVPAPTPAPAPAPAVGSGPGGLNASAESKSFWKRQVSRVPGSIRPAQSKHSPSIVIGAQHTFGSHPLKHLTGSSATGSPNASPKPDRRAIHSRDEFVTEMSDAWGDADSRPRRSRQPSGADAPMSTPSMGMSSSPSSTSIKTAAGPPPPSTAALDSAPPTPTPAPTAMDQRRNKVRAVLEAPTVDMANLKKLCWAGIPTEFRALCWQLLMGYLPPTADRRDATLARKRKEYADTVEQNFGTEEPADKALMHQIHIDVLRTLPSPLYGHERIQRALERVLYCWAIRHPASGYVQGINDLLTPFVSVFLGPHLDAKYTNVDTLSEDTLANAEADAFWCLTKLIDGIQDNYTFAQPGIQKQVARLKDLVGRIDAPLAAHLAQEGIEFIQFAFRWMNCLLMREVKHPITIRMWDTYLSEDGDLNDFHVYVCAAFLVKWSKELRTMSFPDIMLFLQSPPTAEWGDKETELLLSEAFMWKSLFHNSPNHLAGK